MPQATSIIQRRRTQRAEERRARTSRFQMGGVGLGIILSLFIAILILLAALAYADLTRDLPNIELLPTLLNPPDGLLLQPTRIYDRTGQHLLFTFSPDETSATPRRYIPLNPQTPQHLPDFLAKATVAVADPSFWNHSGYSLVDWQNPDSHPTIAQKLVSELLLYDEPPSWRRAIRERILAAQITAKYGRTQILEWYLNSANYGHYAFGAGTASQLYFGKSVSELTPAEAAVLAATSDAPSLNPFDARDVALQRGRDLIYVMASLKVITTQQANDALSLPPSVSPPIFGENGGRGRGVAPAFLNLALEQLDAQFTRERVERGGLNVTTTLDYDLQGQASCVTLAYAAQLANAVNPSVPCDAARLLPSLPIGTTVSEPSASALILDPQSGQILAAVGETLRDEETAFLTAHDPGSLTTPFIYLTAFTRGLSPASLVWDIPSADNIQNPDVQFHGPVRIRVALDNDYLVPAQTIQNQMGTDAIHQIESSFGLEDIQHVSLLDAAAAYAALDAQGVRYGHPGPTAVLRVEGLDHSLWLDWSAPQAQPVVTPQLAYLMNNVLSDETARWPSLGHPSALEIGRPAGVKIGQTNSGLDSWTIGYTPSRTVAVWTGTHASDSQHISPKLSAGLWSVLIQIASQSLPSAGWTIPAGVSVMNVCDPSGLLPTQDCPSIVSEVFLNGNEPVQPDNLYRIYAVNRETGFLATVFTPPQLIENKVFMVIPAEAQAWAKSANIAAAPTAYDAIQPAQVNPDVHISAPAMFAEVNGQVQFTGSASGADFDHYRILVGKGLNPQEWIQVGVDTATPVEDGVLATWDTTGLNGLYAVQLQVIRADQRVDTAVTQVTITNK